MIEREAAGLEGSRFYDDDAVYANYRQRRERVDNPNDTLEGPVMMALLGDLAGHDFLDLGCGAGGFGRTLLDGGAASYHGIDDSAKMIARAEATLREQAGSVTRSDLRRWTYPPERFDRVTARLVLHYVEALEPVLHSVHRTLRADGLFVFSVEHPVITSCDRAADGLPRRDWIVDAYFETGRRVTRWLGADVVKYHRTVEDYFEALRLGGFRVEHVRESKPVRSNFEDLATFERRQRIPLFLVMAARKA